MGDFAVRFVAASAKWFILFTTPAFAIRSVLDAPLDRTLEVLLLGALAIVGGFFLAFRLERALVSRLANEELEVEH